ncbi:Hypothetical predicted protein [Paramuricea clavata]|uniref:Uncharacterized protein n=1 Tax=Paramuricea clavata TaxID=317549 RepID=A0A6S7GUW0_PARCT|nr:Hypothetical predicted protein [Paramuricea clavata]
MIGRAAKRARVDDSGAEEVEKHDGGFVTPLQMFATFPHNITFEETRELKLLATPASSPDSDMYTFIHNRQEYGVMRLEDATISAELQVSTNAGGNPGNTFRVAPMTRPLAFGWKTKEIYVNNDLVNTTTTHESEIAYINAFLTETPDGRYDKRDLCLGWYDTAGQFDDTVGFHNGTNVVNVGGRRRANAVNIHARFKCLDKLDLLGHNKRFCPTSFDVKVELTRLPKHKFFTGIDANVTAVKMRYHDLTLTIPMMKPVAQLSAAINELMIQNSEECKFYTTTYRYVGKPLAIGAQNVQVNDIFNGGRPTRFICFQKTQARYNGDNALNFHSMPFPNINHFQVKINEANIPPLITNSKEAYLNLIRVLDKRHSQMPVTYSAYQSDFGIIVVDLTTNRDSYNQVLPNSTAGVVSVDIKYTAALQAAQQLVFIGEFRNQLSIGYKTAVRNKFEF